MKKNNTLVSVIIPCYNAGIMIEETFLSLEKQTYNNFEVICINDGSTDDTLKRLLKIKERSKISVNIINQENKGVSVSRNRGMQEAVGKYILFLDSDDIYHPTFIEQMVVTKNKLNVDTVYCRLSRDLNEISTLTATSISPVFHKVEESMHKLLYEMGKYGFCCYLYSKDVLLKNEIKFDVNTKYGEDREFNWKYLSHCNTAGWIDLPLYGYRNNDNSVTNTASWSKIDLLTSVRRTEKYLKKIHCPYYEQYSNYMYARSMWAVAKTFALAKRKDLYIKLNKEFDVKTTMKRTSKDSNVLVKISSVLYLIHPLYYYYALQLKK